MIKENYIPTEEGVVIHRVQDCQPILEANRRAFNESPKAFGEMAEVADVPVVVYEQWLKELPRNASAKERMEFFRKKLNDPENAYFRTRPGRI